MVIHQILPQEIQHHKLPTGYIPVFCAVSPCMLTRFMHLSLYIRKENPCLQMKITLF